MRVNIDSKALQDPRLKRLGGRLGIPWHEALGRCIPVWMHAYDNRSAEMASQDVDALGELAGLSDAMVSVDLATQSGPDRVRLRGVTARIEFLLTNDVKLTKANNARRAKLEAAESRGTAAGPSPGNAPRQGPYSLAPDHDQTPRVRLPPGRSPGKVPGEMASEDRSAMLRDVVRGVHQHSGDGDIVGLVDALPATGTSS